MSVRDTSQVADEPSSHHREYAPDFDCSFSSNLPSCRQLQFITATMMSRVLLFLALVVLSANVRLALLLI
jgi:hypothetical protein